MNFSEVKDDFDTNGFAVLRNFFSLTEMEEINNALNKYIDHTLPKLDENEAFYEKKEDPKTLMRLQNMGTHDPFFSALFHGKRLQSISQNLLGSPVRGKNLQWFNKLPVVGRLTPPHQDGFYFMLEPNQAITLWLAQDPIDESNGCIRYLPGSHRKGMRAHKKTDVLGFSQGLTEYKIIDIKNEIPVCVEPGDLIAHHSMTIHRADANKSNRPRRALGFVYFSQTATEDSERAEAYRKKLYDDWEKQGKI